MGHPNPLRSGAPRARLLYAGVAAVLVAVAACSGDGDAGLDRAAGSTTSSSSSAPAAPEAPEDRPRGGVARVAVWAEPDTAAPTHGGAAVRDLVLPQLHELAPTGSWVPSLLEEGSEEEAPDLGSVSFRLRSDARWSDGSPITADDLRRSADARFVAAVDGPDATGRITVRFTQRLSDWRRLWSGFDSVSPPAPGVWGGPFVVAGRDPGLEVVLHPNPEWWGPGPFLDEVRLVLVPDQTTTMQLFETGELDVVAPLPFPARIRQLSSMPGVSRRVGSVDESGWWVGLFLEPSRLELDQRRAVMATVDRSEFVGTLLKDEAVVLNGFSHTRAAQEGPWRADGPGDPVALSGEVVDLVGTDEEPLTGLLQRSMQQRARPADAVFELRNADADLVSGWVAAGEYDAAIVVTHDPRRACWTCRWASVDEDLARRADAGFVEAIDELERRLRDDAIVLPLWRSRPVVAWRDGLRGVDINGYGLSAAWDAESWFRE